MDVICWNCKTKITLDKAAIEAAIKTMDDTKIDIFDVACASCGKTNRTQRDVFTKALQALAEPHLTQRELTKQTKEENARRRGEDVGKKGRG